MAISSSVESGTIVSPATAIVGKADTPAAPTGLSGLIGQPLSTVTLPTDTDNYETLTGTIRLYRRSSGGGGGRRTSRYTVSFESNGGSKVSNQTVTRNSVMKEPTAPTKENFDFDGWYSDKELKTKYDFSAKVTILITIGSATLKVNGKEIKLDSPAFIENDRTYTPIRFISENLGASVEWVEKDQKVIITKPEIKKAETK